MIDLFMKKSATFILVFILLLTAVGTASPQSVRSFKTTTLDSLRQDPGLQYRQNPDVLTAMWQDFWVWLMLKLTPYISGKTALLLIKIIGYALALAAVIAIVYFSLRSNGVALFGKTASVDPSPAVIGNDDIYSLDLSALLQDCIQEGRLREAVRLLYLIGLKALADNGDVQWRKGKTNHDYLNDLRNNKNLYNIFRELTRSYEFIWYGRTEIGAETFEHLKQRFVAVIPGAAHA